MTQNMYANQVAQGDDVYGSDGEKIGSVAAVAQDHFVIEKGFIFTTDLYVPTSAIAGVDDDGVRLAMTKDQIENQEWSEAPMAEDTGYGAEGYASGETAGYADTAEVATDDAYATQDVSTGAVGGTDYDAGYGTASTTDTDRIQRTEERLVVDKDVEQAGSVRVGKNVVEARQAVDVPVTREEVVLERHAVDAPASDATFSDQEIEVPVYEERVTAAKEARVVEELEVGKRSTTGTEHVEDTVRREEFDIDTDADLRGGTTDRLDR
jgi:uncharacterized protein (TIGR02271 family)